MSVCVGVSVGACACMHLLICLFTHRLARLGEAVERVVSANPKVEHLDSLQAAIDALLHAR
jgi:hypothetical protein